MKKVPAVRSAALATVLLLGPAVGPAPAVTVTKTAVDGLGVYLYAWTDSHGLRRSVALKREGAGNPGHGGYAVAAAYQYKVGAVTRKKVVKPSDAGDGFGYFVSHERYRLFSDGSSATIADKVFHVDDSPLGRGFPVATQQFVTGPSKAIIRFSLTYSHYGTIAANGIDTNTGDDRPPLGASPSLFRKYDLPVDIIWYFQDGTDYPRIRTQVHLNALPGPDRVSFDVRGPYGKLNFDGGAKPIAQVRWGDSRHFVSTRVPLTRNSTWNWNSLNAGARYSALTAGGFEMGLIEPRLYRASQLNDGYADGRGKTSTTYFGGAGCPFETQLLPCDYEWPYQSAQYELPYDNPDGVTTSEKMAWGSSPYYGTSLTSTYDGLASHPFRGFPASKLIAYDVCLVLGPSTGGGLTRSVALGGGNYLCADTTRF